MSDTSPIIKEVICGVDIVFNPDNKRPYSAVVGGKTFTSSKLANIRRVVVAELGKLGVAVNYSAFAREQTRERFAMRAKRMTYRAVEANKNRLCNVVKNTREHDCGKVIE